MKIHLQLWAMCGLLAVCLNAALAQKADFPAAARHAGELARQDQASSAITPGELEQRKARVITKVPPAERPAFVAATPGKTGEAEALAKTKSSDSK